jgi:succinyl-CoA synthetase beta subunit
VKTRSDGHQVTAGGRGRAGPVQTSKESGDGSEACSARGGLDGRLGIRWHG